MRFPLVCDLAAAGVPVAVACEVLGFSCQAFYSWQRDPVCDRDWDDAHLLNTILDVHADDPEFGYRFITDELERAGHTVSENRVHRLCREHQSGRRRPARAAVARGRPPARPSTMTSSSAASPPAGWMRSRSQTSPSTPPPRAGSTSARSRTSAPTGSSATRWVTG